jgi:hypothetical protein
VVHTTPSTTSHSHTQQKLTPSYKKKLKKIKIKKNKNKKKWVKLPCVFSTLVRNFVFAPIFRSKVGSKFCPLGVGSECFWA